MSGVGIGSAAGGSSALAIRLRITSARIGYTGGGNGKHMVYLSGLTDHDVQDEAMIAHVVELVEAKAAEIEAGRAVSMDVTHGKAA